ncbi:hypothetical protein ILUMI_08018 [Ignelater luminosus]|uniref:Uncharacterized protein n=1 Tax=Ignelater luminosus TaxID=2038154 RepID=A0A8K0D2D6_IGNLU|nr:hypothetical protein ILUMI_08018 [Ignelater luminosus]
MIDEDDKEVRIRISRKGDMKEDICEEDNECEYEELCRSTTYKEEIEMEKLQKFHEKKKNGLRIWTEDIDNAIKEKHKAYLNTLHNNTQEARLNYIEKRNKAKDIVRRTHQESWDNLYAISKMTYTDGKRLIHLEYAKLAAELGKKPPKKIEKHTAKSRPSVFERTIQTSQSGGLRQKSSPNEVYAHHVVAIRRQLRGKNVDQYMRALKQLAKDCNLKSITAEENKNDYIRDSFIAGICLNKIKEQLLENSTLTLDKVCNQALSLEMAETNSQRFETSNHSLNAAIIVKKENTTSANLTASSKVLAASSSRKKCLFGVGLYIKEKTALISTLVNVKTFLLSQAVIPSFTSLKNDIAKSALAVIDNEAPFTVENNVLEHVLAATLSQQGYQTVEKQPHPTGIQLLEKEMKLRMLKLMNLTTKMSNFFNAGTSLEESQLLVDNLEESSSLDTPNISTIPLKLFTRTCHSSSYLTYLLILSSRFLIFEITIHRPPSLAEFIKMGEERTKPKEPPSLKGTPVFR